MQGPERPRFRPTLALWTPITQVLPAVLRGDLVNRDDVVRFDAESTRRETWQPLPDDFAIREVLEAKDDQVLEFMSTHGVLGYGESALASLPDDRPDLFVVTDGLPLAVAVHKLRVLRVLAKMVVADAAGDQVGVIEAWSSEGFNHPPQPDPDDQAWTAWRIWTEHVNAALTAFPIFVEFDRPVGAPWGRGRMAITPYEVAILQLVQIATEGREINRCANERCGRPFTRQRTSRRQYVGTEHATGLRYCSRGCAKAQSERERRARRRSEESA